MKSFRCGAECKTAYWNHDKISWYPEDKITHVNKICEACNWQSFKTKMPEKLQ